jgi:conjugal transfer pilus assembly protein TraV
MTKPLKKTTYKFSLVSILLIALSSLGGCAGMNSEFACNARAGDSCTPVSVVNKNAEAGRYDNINNASAQQSHTFVSQLNYPIKPQNVKYSSLIANEPIRLGETIQRIWLAPYKDTEHNFHEESYVYIVLKKAHWIDSVKSQ